jgi:hypothetical protein
MLTEKPEHMTDEEWSAFNDDEMGEAPSLKYQDEAVKLDDEVEALLAEQPKNDEPVVDPIQEPEKPLEPVNLDDIEVPDTGASTKLEKLTSEYAIAKNELTDLQQRWEDGELTEAEYSTESNAMTRKMARLEGKIEAAEEQAEYEAAKIERYNEQIKQAWDYEETKFFQQPENKKFLESPRMMKALNEIVIELQQQPNLTAKEFGKLLQDARNSYTQEFGEFYQGAKQPEPIKQPTKPHPRKVEPPKTLANIPVAEPNNVLDGRFAVLDNIKDPEQLEKAIARMSPSDRDAYLRGAA